MEAQSVVGAGNALSISINGHMAVTNVPALSNAFTFEAWVKVLNTNSFNTNGYHTILSRGGGQLPTSTADYIFQVQPGGLLALFAAGAWDASPSPVITPEVWTHVAVTFDGAMKRFFSNGVEVASVAREGALQSLPATEPLFVGRQGSACNCNFFAGDLDEVRVWNVARSGAEIADRHNRSLAGTEPGLTAYYRFDEAAGLTVADVSGQARTGVIAGNFLHVPSGATVFSLPSIVSFSVASADQGFSALSGAVTLGGLPGLTWFEWGTNGGFQFAGVPAAIPVTDFTTNVVSLSLDLPPGPWQARLTASNAMGATSRAVAFASPLFGEVPVSGLGNRTRARGAWADWDNDGRLEAIITGDGPLLAIRNSGLGLFVTGVFFIPQVPTAANGDVTFADYDNDGFMDFLLGMFSDSINGLWRGFGGAFLRQTLNGLPSSSANFFPEGAAWGDYDNDGRLDFLFPRQVGAPLWRNLGAGFAGIEIGGYPGLNSAAATWMDYDNDGWLDFLVTGSTANGLMLLFQRNTGTGFSNVAGHPFPPIVSGDFAWGDFDNDGRLDCLAAGASSNPVAGLWRNTGNGFSPVPIPGLPGLSSCDVAWGDYDNDGRLDFLIGGYTGFSNIVQLWQNTGAGFTNVFDGDLNVHSVSWGDYDNDGRLDILLAGDDQSRFWRNRTPAANTPPTAPTGLAMTATSNGVMFSWNAATDAQTPSAGLSYNVRAGTTPGGIDLISPHADPVTGFRRLPELGNAQMRRFMFLNGVTNGQTIYWSVQAVDTAFAGGAWASEVSTVSLPQLAINPSSNGRARVSWTPPTSGWRLQENSILDTDGWSNSPSGELNPATLPAAESQRFFRLQRP